jgi:hypothetical protein
MTNQIVAFRNFANASKTVSYASKWNGFKQQQHPLAMYNFYKKLLDIQSLLRGILTHIPVTLKISGFMCGKQQKKLNERYSTTVPLSS